MPRTFKPGWPAVAALWALGLGPAAVQGETLTLASGDWPPYVSTQLQHDGLTARIVRAAFARAGMEVDVRFFPWPRAMLAAERGQVDATFVWSHKPERDEKFLFSDSVGQYGYVLFYPKAAPFEWHSLADLAGRRIGGTLSYNYGDEFLQADKDGQLRVEWVHSDELNWRKLMAGRIDTFPQDLHVGYAQLADLFPADEAARITHHPTPLKPLTSMHVLFPKKLAQSSQRLQKFNEGLRQLQAEGTIERYLQEFRETGYRVVTDEVIEDALKQTR